MNNFKDKKADIELVYKVIDGLELPLQVFLPDCNIHKANSILVIHGGGWNDAIKDNSQWDGGWMGNNARYLAEKGLIGIVISYRSLMISDKMNVEMILEDCIDAVRYIKKNLKFIDYDNITYMGDSAGGYLVTMLGLSQDDQIRPKRVVALNPVLEALDTKWKYGFNHCDDIGRLTPGKNIGEKSAEFLFVHGTADTTVEIEHTEALHNQLLKSGHKSEFLKIPEAQHAFILYDYKYPDNYVNNIMEKVLAAMR